MEALQRWIRRMSSSQERVNVITESIEQELVDQDSAELVEYGFPRKTLFYQGLPYRAGFLGHLRFFPKARLRNLCIPSSIEHIPTDFLRNVKTVEIVAFEYGSRLMAIPTGGFSMCSALLSICIPQSVETIRGDAFSHCRSLRSLTFECGSALRLIQFQAFFRCVSLVSLDLPRSLEILADASFARCHSLQFVNIPLDSQLTRCKPFSFSECCRLRSIVLPAGLESFSWSVFKGTQLDEIDVDRQNRFFRVWDSFLIDIDCVSIYRYFGQETEVVIPNCFRMLELDCFAHNSSLANVVFEADCRLLLMKWGAFDSCRNLTAISIPASVEIIGRACFLGCSNLQIVSFLPDSRLESIERGAFASCFSIIQISIPASVLVLGIGCFDRNVSLRDLTFDTGSRLERIETRAFAMCSSLVSVCIPASVKYIGDSCFLGCTSMKNLTFEPGCRARTLSGRAYASSPARRLVVHCTCNRRGWFFIAMTVLLVVVMILSCWCSPRLRPLDLILSPYRLFQSWCNHFLGQMK
jgi:hypothetical protein